VLLLNDQSQGTQRKSIVSTVSVPVLMQLFGKGAMNGNRGVDGEMVSVTPNFDLSSKGPAPVTPSPSQPLVPVMQKLYCAK
jgi:hypothetical protein